MSTRSQRGYAEDVIVWAVVVACLVVVAGIVSCQSGKRSALLYQAGLPPETQTLVIDDRWVAVTVDGEELKAVWIERKGGSR